MKYSGWIVSVVLFIYIILAQLTVYEYEKAIIDYKEAIATYQVTIEIYEKALGVKK